VPHNLTDACVNSYLSPCDTWTIGDWTIQSPELVPTCVAAAVIGITAGNAIRKLVPVTTNSRIMYMITFYTFAVMMSDASLTDCLLAHVGNDNDDLHFFVGLVDVVLTSSVALSFSFNALADLDWISGDSMWTRACMLFSYGVLLAAWIIAFEDMMATAFQYLYIDLIAISCSFYAAVQVYLLVKSKSTAGLRWVSVGVAAGALGLAGVAFPDFDTWLCHQFGCHFAGNFLWFMLTDVSMYALYRYYLARNTTDECTCQAAVVPPAPIPAQPGYYYLMLPSSAPIAHTQ